MKTSALYLLAAIFTASFVTASLHVALNHLKRAVTTPRVRRQPWRSAGNLAVLTACFWFSTQARAATFVVTSAADAGVNTLRSIVEVANVDPPGDIITFATNINLITISSGEIVIMNDFTISGPGATNLTIIGESPHDRAFEIKENKGIGVAVTISGLRFTGGFDGADGPPSTQLNPNGQPGTSAQGGIIYNDKGCVLTLSNCIMDQCFAIGGNGANGFGGVLAPPGTGGNGAAGIGGAVSTVGKLYVYGCTFQGNLALGGNGGDGTNALSSFDGSKGGDAAVAYGGAIYVEYNGDPPAITLANCTFFDNLAQGGVGGRGGDGLPAAHGGAGGKGGDANGGALYHADLNCLLGDCGIMTHCTVNQNYLQPGFGGPGGIGNINGVPGANGMGSGGGLCLRPQFFEVGNTIVAGDGGLGAAVITAPDVQGDVASQGFNLIGVDDCNNCSGWTVIAPGLDQRGTVGIPLDPRLGPLQNNGGETPTMTPLAGSPAIDFGGPTVYSTDQAGQTRPVIVAGIQNGGDGSDIGAYELQCSLDIPALSVMQSGNGVLLSWPWPSTCFVLQQSSNLQNWVDSTYPINMVGNLNQVLISPPVGNLFFRLKK